MRIRLLIRTATAALLGALCGMYIYSYRMKWSLLGEDAYLDHESLVFARTIAHPKNVKTIIELAFMALVVAAVYELIVAGVWRLVKSTTSST